jgi:hypothetical protein
MFRVKGWEGEWCIMWNKKTRRGERGEADIANQRPHYITTLLAQS